MASISYSEGRATIQFIDVDSKRKSIRLGTVPKRTAEAVKLRVEALLNAKITNTPVDRDTATWLTGVGADLADKLTSVGLIDVRDQTTLAAFVESYIAGRSDVKPRTTFNLQHAATRMVEYFGANKPLRALTPADGDAFIVWLKARYAPATAARTVRRARQFLTAAVRARLIAANPFDGLKTPGDPDESRKVFVDRPTIDCVLGACPDAEWRLIIAFSRYAGIRIPSELVPLTWADVNWERGRIFIRSPKTEHHEGKGARWVPIFPELRPYLEDAYEQAEPGTVYVVNRYRDAGKNLRQQFERIIVRAGATPWPKLFHNMRASRETELAAEYPLHVVCSWIGNSAAIAKAHYLTVTDADYEKAISERAKDGAAKSGAADPKALQNPVQSASDRKGRELTQPTIPSVVSRLSSSQVLSCQGLQTTQS